MMYIPNAEENKGFLRNIKNVYGPRALLWRESFTEFKLIKADQQQKADAEYRRNLKHLTLTDY